MSQTSTEQQSQTNSLNAIITEMNNTRKYLFIGLNTLFLVYSVVMLFNSGESIRAISESYASFGADINSMTAFILDDSWVIFAFQVIINITALFLIIKYSKKQTATPKILPSKKRLFVTFCNLCSILFIAFFISYFIRLPIMQMGTVG